ncbi:MAG: Crp/Fnr family transcriptional regulator [Candidatus Korobacteraceae bacterium]
MKNVGPSSNILSAPPSLKSRLQALGQTEQVPAGAALFKTGDCNLGVFLIRKGKVCLRVEDLPRFDRVFPAGSLLGLPSTFAGNEYSLTAIAVTNSEVVRVNRDKFLRLMREEPVLCRQATDMLSREVSFIQAAVAERMQAVVAAR